MITRSGFLANQIVIVDGQPGCGKTMLSPIVAALDRVELLTYAYELEYVCALDFLNKLPIDASSALSGMLTDLQIYNTMMGRSINVRPSDLSSIWRDIDPMRYIRRMLSKGDEHIPARITAEQPILHLTTHNLLAFSRPLWNQLGNRLTFIEVVRHPLYMVKQQALNMQNIVGDPRDFTIYYEFEGQQVPYYTQGWEKRFLTSNAIERSVWFMYYISQWTETLRKTQAERIITIPFEAYVLKPDAYMQQICQRLQTTITAKTARMMKTQKVPRQRIEDGLALNIYRRCGWTPPSGKDEKSELNDRYEFVAKQVNKETLSILDNMIKTYESTYMDQR